MYHKAHLVSLHALQVRIMLEGKTMGNSEAEWEKTRVMYDKLLLEIDQRNTDGSDHVMSIRVPPRPNSKGVCVEESSAGPTQGTSIATPDRQNGAAAGTSRS